MTDHRAQVDQLLADYARSRELLATAHQRLAAITATERSVDGSITVTVGSRGTLTGLTLADDAYRAYRPSELANEILRLVTSASQRALAEAADVLAPTLPADTDPKATLLGTADLTPDEIPPASRPTPRADPTDAEDEDFADTNWVAEGRRDRS
ncbi:YbaB/EbfC family nucleoid-associated protein [Haloechinothrix halophila]|uniref:YbaB/EbfC family nucleoid-associated protein n=1 Tax=Haloechinothrix halophila TaxID=1069073 RepID=UPI000555C79A|nr:YbaB/EbfC family nucleoid-associated protein [Haloechinothrix halophila]